MGIAGSAYRQPPSETLPGGSDVGTAVPVNLPASDRGKYHAGPTASRKIINMVQQKNMGQQKRGRAENTAGKGR